MAVLRRELALLSGRGSHQSSHHCASLVAVCKLKKKKAFLQHRENPVPSCGFLLACPLYLNTEHFTADSFGYQCVEAFPLAVVCDTSRVTYSWTHFDIVYPESVSPTKPPQPATSDARPRPSLWGVSGALSGIGGRDQYLFSVISHYLFVNAGNQR